MAKMSHQRRVLMSYKSFCQLPGIRAEFNFLRQVLYRKISTDKQNIHGGVVKPSGPHPQQIVLSSTECKPVRMIPNTCKAIKEGKVPCKKISKILQWIYVGRGRSQLHQLGDAITINWELTGFMNYFKKSGTFHAPGNAMYIDVYRAVIAVIDHQPSHVCMTVRQKPQVYHCFSHSKNDCIP